MEQPARAGRPDLKPAGSKLFTHIETLQGQTPWGDFLDAGTGVHSAGWATGLPTRSLTAVTAAEGHAAQVRARWGRAFRPEDRLLVGQWADPAFLETETFDTVLADYLVGAVDGFAPYFQFAMLERLRRLTRGRLYVVGLEPYVPYGASDPAGRIVGEIGRLRDACLLLAGERPYREYPSTWMIEALQRAGFQIAAARRFPIRYKASFVESQIKMCLMRIKAMPDRGLGEALAARAEAARRGALDLIEAEGGLKTGADYVIAAT